MQTQPFTPAKVAKARPSTLAINRQIYAYTLMRAVSSPRLLNVCAVNKKGELIVVVESDLEFDEASTQVEQLNLSLGHTEPQTVV